MEFSFAKAENCFADSETYEYRLPVTAQELLPHLAGWVVRENHKYRRPMFTADWNGVNMKGVLSRNVIRVSFPENRWKTEKAAFETWLGGVEAG